MTKFNSLGGTYVYDKPIMSSWVHNFINNNQPKNNLENKAKLLKDRLINKFSKQRLQYSSTIVIKKNDRSHINGIIPVNFLSPVKNINVSIISSVSFSDKNNKNGFAYTLDDKAVTHINDKYKNQINLHNNFNLFPGGIEKYRNSNIIYGITANSLDGLNQYTCKVYKYRDI